MTNGMAAIDHVTSVLAQMRREYDLAVNRLADIEKDIAAIEGALRVLRTRAAGNTPEIIDPKKLRGKSQLEALKYIARRSKGEVKVTDARRLLLHAGLIRNPKNASSILYTVINRSEMFERVGTGIYRLKSFKGEHAKVTAIRSA